MGLFRYRALLDFIAINRFHLSLGPSVAVHAYSLPAQGFLCTSGLAVFGFHEGVFGASSLEVSQAKETTLAKRVAALFTKSVVP